MYLIGLYLFLCKGITYENFIQRNSIIYPICGFNQISNSSDICVLIEVLFPAHLAVRNYFFLYCPTEFFGTFIGTNLRTNRFKFDFAPSLGFFQFYHIQLQISTIKTTTYREKNFDCRAIYGLEVELHIYKSVQATVDGSLRLLRSLLVLLDGAIRKDFSYN